MMTFLSVLCVITGVCLLWGVGLMVAQQVIETKNKKNK